MRHFLLLIFTLLLTVATYGQVEIQPQLVGTFSGGQVGGGPTSKIVGGAFTDASGTYDASNVQVGDFLFFTSDGYSFFLPIDSILFASPPSIQFRVKFGGITQASSIPFGNTWAIYRGNKKGLFPVIAGPTAADQQSLQSYNMKILADQLEKSKTYQVNESDLYLTDSIEVLSQKEHIFIDVRRSNATPGSVVLPVIDESLINTEFVIQAWVETGATPVGVFPGGSEQFVTGQTGGEYFGVSLMILADKDRMICKPVYDEINDIWYWSTAVVKANAFVSNDVTNPNVLYVAPYGSDSDAGSLYKPFLTIGAALTAASSGTLIYVFPGSYSATGNLMKNGVTVFFDGVTAGSNFTASEGFIGTPLFVSSADSENFKVRGTLTTYQLVRISHKDVSFDAEGYLLGQVLIGPGANRAKVNVRATLTPGAVYQYMNTADTVTRNNVSFVASAWVPYATFSTGHVPIAYFNNTSTRSKLNNYNIQIGSVNMTNWIDVYSNRGIIQCRSVGMAFDSTTLRLDIGKGNFDLVGTNVPSFGMLAFFPFQAAVGNQLFVNCDECIFKNRATLANSTFQSNTTDLIKITGNYKTYNKQDPFFLSQSGIPTTNRTVFDGYFYANDTTMFILSDRANWEFSGVYKNRENDDLLISANWASTGSYPVLRNTIFDSPHTTPIQSTVATVWNVANARETKTVTKDADITFSNIPAYDTPSIITGTARTIPYINTNGRFVPGNTYARFDTTTTAGALGRMKFNLNKTFDISSPDSYAVFDIFSGDAANSGGNFFMSDQLLGMITAGFDPRMVLYRYGGSLNSASNLTNGLSLGRFGFGGWVNGGRNNNLSGIYSNYRGNGTTLLADLLGVINGGTAGWRLDETYRFWLGDGADDYSLPVAAPAYTNGYKTMLVQTGVSGTSATPSWQQIKQDTTISFTTTDYNLGNAIPAARVRDRYNRIIITGYIPTSGPTGNAVLILPAPSSDYNQTTISLFAFDENATYAIGISAPANSVMVGDGSYTNQYPAGNLLGGQTVHIRCQLDPKDSNNYKWTVGN